MSDVRCPKCGRRTTIRTAKKDDCEYHVCINYPRCRGRVVCDEDWGDDWGKERPASKTTHDWTRRQITPYPPGRRAETTVRTAKKEGRKVPAVIKRPQRKGGVSIDETWGDDWGKEIPTPKPAPYRSQYPRAQKRQVASEIKEPPRPRSQTALKREAAPEKKESPKPQQQKAPKPASYVPQYKRVPKSYAAPERKEPPEPRQPKAPKPVSYRPQYKRPPKKYVAPEKEETSESQQQKASKRASFLPLYKRAPKVYVAPDKEKTLETMQQVVPKKEVVPEKKVPPKLRKQVVPKEELALEEKKPSRPWWRRAPKKEAAPEKKEPPRPRQQRGPKPADVKPQSPKVTEAAHLEFLQPVVPDIRRDEPLQQIAPKADTAPEVKASPKLRQRRVPQSYLAPRRKKRSMTVIVIAIVIAFLAIDGMIYAAFVLR